jgi:aldehyde dehydrogenase (NAD+)
VILGSAEKVGVPLVRHVDVSKVAFTGSMTAGIRVAQAAAEHLAPVSLELGGKSANIVFADANVERAAAGAIAAGFAASGQMCFAGSRLLVEDSIYSPLLARLVELTEAIRVGDPRSTNSDMAPLVSELAAQSVISLVDRTVADGAELVTGGRRKGAAVEPTILVDVHPDMEVAREEIFGPVLGVTRFSTEDEAIRLANGVRQGLAAGVWTSDIGKAHRVASKLNAGTVWINSYRTLHPAVPFGGFGTSGFGFENGLASVKEFTRQKTVWVEIGESARNPFEMA